MSRIFLSYNFSDRQFAMQVYYYLRKQKNIDSYFYEEYEHRENWITEVGEQLSRCQAFVLFLGKELGDTQLKEAQTALNLKNISKLILIKKSNIEKPISLALFHEN